jgi:uncharacterized spore protein YtfJ
MSDELESNISVGKEEFVSTVETVQNVLERFNAAASVEAVYQKPVEHGENMIITAAEVTAFMGFGLGGGRGTGENPNAGSGTGVGGGGGGNVFSRPVAVIVSTPGGVEVTPIFDITKIALAAMTTGMLVMGAVARAASLRRRVERVQSEMLRGES